ncbi:MAG: transporter related protein [Clostridia bacterium]|jgi:simple sugar transport system ATP-binding protein|nr:transporter related protein [Clostridia bacterium]
MDGCDQMEEIKRIKLKMQDISIEFPGVKALSNVDFEIESGRIHALIGANGAGKSTLMKVLAGANTHYTGEIFIDGELVEIRSPKEAKNKGIEIVYQEVDTALIPYLSVAENIMLNSIVNKMGKKQMVNWKEVKRSAEAILKKLNMKIDVNTLVSNLSLAEKQMVLIARAVALECRFLILDEPTAPLSNTETKELFRIVRDLAQNENVGIIFISHRLHELFEICESITVMKDGTVVANMDIDENLTPNQIVELMLGRRFDDTYPKKQFEIGEVVLEVKGLSEKDGAVKNVTFDVRKGEIVGLAGLVGAGKTELCKTLFGAMKQSGGEIKLNGKLLKITNPYTAVKQGLALVPEERRKEGILVEDPVYANLSATSLKKYTNKFSFVNKKLEKQAARDIIKDLGIKTPSEDQLVKLLSGGNQQKVAVGKWLVSDAEVYIFDEPTKGVDVGAKRDIFELIERLVEMGKGVIYASCEFSEILAIADKTYVMYDGEIAKELKVSETNEQELLYYSTGGH